MNLLFALILLIAGLTFAICGLILKKYPPKKINMLVGYRTPFSRKNIDTWTVANAYCAEILIYGGGIFICLGLISFALPDIGMNGLYVGNGLILIYTAILIAATERHLNKLFDKNGNRK